jgi:hypothetical protein
MKSPKIRTKIQSEFVKVGMVDKKHKSEGLTMKLQTTLFSGTGRKTP